MIFSFGELPTVSGSFEDNSGSNTRKVRILLLEIDIIHIFKKVKNIILKNIFPHQSMLQDCTLSAIRQSKTFFKIIQGGPKKSL
jgi:hypothetical protein